MTDSYNTAPEAAANLSSVANLGPTPESPAPESPNQVSQPLHEALCAHLTRLPQAKAFGRVTAVNGLTIEASGLEKECSLGRNCVITNRKGQKITGEIVGFSGDRCILLPLDTLQGLGPGCRIQACSGGTAIAPCAAWLGRVIGADGQPRDNQGALPQGDTLYPLEAPAPLAYLRQRVEEKLDLGVRVLNSFTTCCRGQRMGIFSGSGVGKSTLLGMIARGTAADVVVIGLIGERGRELREWLEKDLGSTRARTIVVCATSDESPLARRRAAHMTFAIAEAFSAQGQHVLCLFDSVTRYAMALREIGLAAGEAPTSRGYTPSVFAALPKLLERAGPGIAGAGSITGIFSVLVEGDDFNEPISDAIRGILDGHIVLTRKIAERGQFPAVSVTSSVSRLLPGCNSPEENAVVDRARRLISRYEDMEDLIRLGVYRYGSDPDIDAAIDAQPRLFEYLCQKHADISRFPEGYAQLAHLLADIPNAQG